MSRIQLSTWREFVGEYCRVWRKDGLAVWDDDGEVDVQLLNELLHDVRHRRAVDAFVCQMIDCRDTAVWNGLANDMTR